MAKLKEKFKFLPRSPFAAKEGKDKGFFPFYTSSQLQKKFIDEYQFEGDSVILGMGGSANVHFQNKKFATSSDCFVLQKTGNYPEKLLYYYLYGNLHILQRGFQGAGLHHISKSYIENIDLPELDQASQQEIILTLDKIQSIIDKRKESFQVMDELIDSNFLSLSWVQNPGYKDKGETELKRLLVNDNAGRTGPFGSDLKHDEFTEDGDVAVLGIDNAVNNYFQWGQKRFISKSKYKELKRYTVYPRDVVITIMGTVGRSAVIPDDIPLAINTKHLAALTLNEELANPYYLSYAIHTDPYIRFQLKNQSRGAIMSGLNLRLIKDVKTFLPPIDIQNRFENIYISLTDRKLRLMSSLTFLENLFKSFIQIAFNRKSFNEVTDLDRYLEDILMQEELIGRLRTQDFQDLQDYHKAKKILFELLTSNRSMIKQSYNSEKGKIELQLLFNETN